MNIVLFSEDDRLRAETVPPVEKKGCKFSILNGYAGICGEVSEAVEKPPRFEAAECRDFDRALSESFAADGFDYYVFYKNDERYRHIKTVLKITEGRRFKAGLLNGDIGCGRIELFTSNQLVFRFEAVKAPLPLPPVQLFLGFPRPIQLKRLLCSAASLGFARLLLSGTELGEKSYRQSGLASPEEIAKYLADGVSQAGQTLLPDFLFFDSVKTCLASENNFAGCQKIVFDISEDAVPLNTLQLKKGVPVVAAIGSERGWTDGERRLFTEAGFTVCSMGRRILRTETAVVSALSIILANNGFW